MRKLKRNITLTYIICYAFPSCLLTLLPEEYEDFNVLSWFIQVKYCQGHDLIY